MVTSINQMQTILKSWMKNHYYIDELLRIKEIRHEGKFFPLEFIIFQIYYGYFTFGSYQKENSAFLLYNNSKNFLTITIH